MEAVGSCPALARPHTEARFHLSHSPEKHHAGWPARPQSSAPRCWGSGFHREAVGGERVAFCWGTVREQLPCAGRSRGPKHCRAQKNGINIRKRTSLVTSLKRDYCCRGLVLIFPFKTTHILKGEGAGEIQPFMLILSGHPEAGPTPAAALLAQAPATKGRAGQPPRAAALLVSVKAEHRGWEVRRLKCRFPRSGWPGTGHSEKDGAQGRPRAAAAGQMLTMKAAGHSPLSLEPC